MASGATKQRRERVRRLLADDPELSNRAIGKRLGTAHTTISRDRVWLGLNPPHPTPAGAAEPGNQRAVSHGATSEQRLAPLREERALELRGLYPWLDEIRLGVLADRLARLQSARLWLDQQSGVVRNGLGEPYPIVREVEAWASKVERMLAALEEEARGRRGAGDSLEGIVEELTAGEGEATDTDREATQ